MKQVIKKVASQSTIHQVSKIAKTQSTKRRVIWTLLVLLAAALAIFHIYVAIKSFLHYPVFQITSIKRNEEPVDFPAISLCYQHPMIFTQMNLTQRNMLKEWYDFLDSANFGNHTRLMASAQTLYDNFPDIKSSNTYSLNNMVVNCRYNNQPCEIPSDLKLWNAENNYNCFTLNPTNQSDKLKDTAIPGEETDPSIMWDYSAEGLSIVLATAEAGQSDPSGTFSTINLLTYNSAVRVQIHEPGTNPSPLLHGVDVLPGHSTSVALKAERYRRLPEPYGYCKTDPDKRMEYKYSKYMCFQKCQQKRLVEKCECKSSAFPQDSVSEGLPFCRAIPLWRDEAKSIKDKKNNANQSITDGTVKLPYVKCETETRRQIMTRGQLQHNCDCPDPCEEMVYRKTTTLVQWPSTVHQFEVLKQFQEDRNANKSKLTEAFNTISMLIDGQHKKPPSLVNYTDILFAKEVIRQNFLHLQVYFEDTSLTEHAEAPLYRASNLSKDVGLTLLIWLGVSILSLIEVVELIVWLLWVVVNPRARNFTKRDKTEENEELNKADPGYI